MNKKEITLPGLQRAGVQHFFRPNPFLYSLHLILTVSAWLFAWLFFPLTGVTQDTIAKSKELKTVTVSARKPFIEQTAGKTVMNIAASAIAAGNNAFDILRLAPGVTIDYNSGIAMMGKGGVSVQIDGRLTWLSGEQLANLLRSIQGSAIQSIELITNPSANYDASGTAGIINIRLRKDLAYGTNGTVTVNAGRGRYFKGNADLSLNHRSRWYNLYGNYGFNSNKSQRRLRIDRNYRQNDEITIFNQETSAVTINEGSSYRAGLDIFIDSRNTFAFMIRGNDHSGHDQYGSKTPVSSAPAKVDSIIVSNNPADKRSDNIAMNLNFRSVFDTAGRELRIDMNFLRYNNRDDKNYNNYIYDDTGIRQISSVIFRNSSISSIRIWAAQSDYTHPLNKNTRLEAGAKASLVRTDNKFLFNNFVSGIWAEDPGRSNQFIYDENINAAYLNLHHAFKTTTMQLGLRAEQTISTGHSVTLRQKLTRHYFNLFPSLAFRQPLSPKHVIGLSYSRKIDRPVYTNLNPFATNIDLYTVSRGNPFLEPQYSNVFEVTYMYNKALMVTGGVTYTRNVITEVSIADTVTRILYVQNENLASFQSYSINIRQPFKFTAWWQSENNAGVHYSRYQAPGLAGRYFASGKATLNFNTYHTFSLNTSTGIELSFQYMSSAVRGTYLNAAWSRTDLAVRKSVLMTRLSIKAGIDDLFNSRREKLRSTLPGQEYRIYQKFDTRVMKLSLSYRLGNKNIKGPGQRSRSSSSEENRVGS